MCPFVFSNSKIRQLAFDDITNSLLRQNRLMFNDYFLKECNSLPVRILFFMDLKRANKLNPMGT